MVDARDAPDATTGDVGMRPSVSDSRRRDGRGQGAGGGEGRLRGDLVVAPDSLLLGCIDDGRSTSWHDPAAAPGQGVLAPR